MHDLQQINAVMVIMGSLQPGPLTPTMIPQGWEIIIIDLKDCFFTIPLAEQDKGKFAFTMPCLNHAESNKKHQWKALMARGTGLIKGARAI